ncbi:MAG: hypothetical protein JO263_00105 [Candidatus Eremiobacteraeota bacterium]|nr:hypothetical protein [Candidatus Eremiobacteraeota bacterium]
MQEITLRVNDIRDLFRDREFDPFSDDIDSVGSIRQMAQLPHLASKLKAARLCVLVPPDQLTPQTEARLRRALHRYCAHAIAQARGRLAAMRWVGLRTFIVGLVIFALSLAASTAVQRLLFIPEELRTLASESLIIAGWVVMWNPLDTLVQGWWPHWDEERTFRSIGALPVSVASEGMDAPNRSC